MSLEVLKNRMRSTINSLEPGKEFILRDIENDPPAQLGRVLYEEVAAGRIQNVQYIGKAAGVEKYRKI